MIIQMLSISALYLVLNLPIAIRLAAHACGMPANIGADAQLYTYFIAYWIPLLLPFVCLASMPELWKILKTAYLLQWQRVRRQLTAAVTPAVVPN